MNRDEEPAFDERNDEQEQRLWAALAAKPGVAVPAGFAHRVAVAARAEALQSGGRVGRTYGWGWAGVATLSSLVLLVILMLRFARGPQGVAPLVAEITLSLEFVLLLLGMVYFRRGLD